MAASTTPTKFEVRRQRNPQEPGDVERAAQLRRSPGCRHHPGPVGARVSTPSGPECFPCATGRDPAAWVAPRPPKPPTHERHDRAERRAARAPKPPTLSALLRKAGIRPTL